MTGYLSLTLVTVFVFIYICVLLCDFISCLYYVYYVYYRLGLAYAGTARSEVLEVLRPFVEDAGLGLDTVCLSVCLVLFCFVLFVSLLFALCCLLWCMLLLLLFLFRIRLLPFLCLFSFFYLCVSNSVCLSIYLYVCIGVTRVSGSGYGLCGQRRREVAQVKEFWLFLFCLLCLFLFAFFLRNLLFGFYLSQLLTYLCLSSRLYVSVYVYVSFLFFNRLF